MQTDLRPGPAQRGRVRCQRRRGHHAARPIDAASGQHVQNARTHTGIKAEVVGNHGHRCHAALPRNAHQRLAT